MPVSPVNGDILRLDGETLSLEQVIAVARDFRQVALSPEAKVRMRRSRRLVEQWVRKRRVIYGITTGFGSLQNERIPPEAVEQLQENILLSHSAGVGDGLPEATVRAMMLLRANALAKGYSGIRVEVVERLLDLLNRRVHPVVPAKGSVGSSGDLAPLSHMALVLIGRGEAMHEGVRLSGAEALGKAGIPIVQLKAKEGLALTNGTQFMTAIGALTLWDAERLAKLADIAGAMSLEAVRGFSAAFRPELQKLRPFAGQIACAENVSKMIAGSRLIQRDHLSKRTAPRRADEDAPKPKVQDAYSLRCMPQVHGASREAMRFVRQTLEIEINSATDNPLIMPDLSKSFSAGNFHGQPVALAMDFLALALAELGNIAERRIARLMNKHENFGLPAYLTDAAGLNSGMMLAQYTAAALVSENKVLIHPASGDSIPTSSNQEDHNSMGSIAARQARQVLENVESVVAIELLCAAQALGFHARERKKPGVGTSAAYQTMRCHIPQRASDQDGEIHVLIHEAERLVRDGTLLQAVEQAIGELS
ncbi:MAG TPA: histidine ammonia-lyase [Blastocatellia bacterium]|nr:histidine ammonia-lyase [Blastocatellia bacterium]